jgi:putative exosortase-associated protein (TIGR04073 family)
MKKIIAAVMIFVIVASCQSPAFSDTALDKLGRGLANTLTGVFELPKNMGDESEANGVFAGLTTGAIKGLMDVLIRELVGIYEIATFPIPVPAGYKPILEDPEYFLFKESV